MIYPLEEIGLHPRYHLSALWWLGLLYRKPNDFLENLKVFSKKEQIKFGSIISLHILPYIFFISVVFRFILFCINGISLEPAIPPEASLPYIIVFNLSYLISGIISAGFIGFIFGCILVVIASIIISVTFKFTLGHEIFSKGVCGGISGGIIFGSYFCIVGCMPRWSYNWICGLFMGWMLGGIVGVIVFSYFNEITICLSSTVIRIIKFMAYLVRPYYLFIHLFFVWPRIRGHWYPYHPILWDDVYVVPYWRFDKLLVAYVQLQPKLGEMEIERLLSYPSLRIIVLRVRTILLAHESGKVNNLIKLETITAQLPEGDEGFLAQTKKIREMVGEICSIQRRLDCITRPVLQEPTAALLCKEIENFRHTIAGFPEPLATEFRSAASHWLEIAEKKWNETKAILTKEPTPQIFRAGDPVDYNQEAFVPRYSIFGELEKQLMLSTGCPGLILYGRRRMGKSTILKNVSAFLPNNVIFVIETMENPEAFSSLESFTRLLLKKLKESDSLFSAISDESSDLPGLQRFLENCNQRLSEKNQRLFLALDEYENIDEKIGEGVFSKDLLAMVRTSIQSHRQITWVLSGSHEINELKNAPWSSYLVSARMVEVPPFTKEETRLLLTEPMKYSSLWENGNEARPRFDSSFWGENGIERIHAEAGGWPHLVQLIAETIVDIINDEDTRYVTPDLLERSLDKAIVRGDAVLSRLLLDECSLPGEREYLNGFNKKEIQPIPEDGTIRRSLRRRLIVEEDNGEWRLRVPLMQRWLRKRG